MAYSGTPEVAASSRTSANADGTATNATSLLAVYSDPVYVNIPLLNAMGTTIINDDYSPIWDALNVGGRITQDPNAAQNVGPDLLKDITIQSIDTTIDITDETDAVKAIYTNQLTIADNLTTIVAAINEHRDNYTILLQYMINYKLLNPASS